MKTSKRKRMIPSTINYLK